ncbi:hypothetical protein [Pararobbsia alpina]|jgi:hypothetical protein|uniref:Uncharacterized protein n=1 Tax=Pararobbsia alpina TaxID=621374 RepID=A0A6S7BII5_9BURK|nr:hypothetical protein [Pararobbsia alpina]CAB3792354.1 hypothetical protein LMG28138_03328 [Pararobbsia alpina]
MRTRHTEQHPSSSKAEKNVDKAIEDTFPASDPPSIGGVTKIKQPAPNKEATKKSTKQKRSH